MAAPAAPLSGFFRRIQSVVEDHEELGASGFLSRRLEPEVYASERRAMLSDDFAGECAVAGFSLARYPVSQPISLTDLATEIEDREKVPLRHGAVAVAARLLGYEITPGRADWFVRVSEQEIQGRRALRNLIRMTPREAVFSESLPGREA